ncbi:MAG: hypothetical protein M0Z71_00290 [Nitrospiraceae bacterium]|nr:hypothetical protein [Nitrospiraceae bacterium]
MKLKEDDKIRVLERSLQWQTLPNGTKNDDYRVSEKIKKQDLTPR